MSIPHEHRCCVSWSTADLAALTSAAFHTPTSAAARVDEVMRVSLDLPARPRSDAVARDIATMTSACAAGRPAAPSAVRLTFDVAGCDSSQSNTVANPPVCDRVDVTFTT